MNRGHLSESGALLYDALVAIADSTDIWAAGVAADALEAFAATPPNELSPEVVFVFNAWAKATGRTSTKLLDKRRKRILWALKNYPLADVLDAVRGVSRCPHNMGDNDRKTPYNDLTLVLRDETTLERFRDVERGLAPPGKGVSGRKYQPRDTPAPDPKALESIDESLRRENIKHAQEMFRRTLPGGRR